MVAYPIMEPPGWLTGESYEGFPLSASTVALANSLVVKSGPGRLLSLTAYNNKNAAQFLQIFDLIGVPADGAIPVMVFTVATVANLPNITFGLGGRWFTRGIVVCNSSTAATKTIGAADCWFDVQYL